MPARHTRGKDKKYHINGKVYDELDGTRAKVMHHTAYRTTGGLKRKDLMYNKSRHIVSVKKHHQVQLESRYPKPR